jgi:hypothetical protein
LFDAGLRRICGSFSTRHWLLVVEVTAAAAVVVLVGVQVHLAGAPQQQQEQLNQRQVAASELEQFRKCMRAVG